MIFKNKIINKMIALGVVYYRQGYLQLRDTNGLTWIILFDGRLYIVAGMFEDYNGDEDKLLCSIKYYLGRTHA